jgi:16S rRNA (guanine527-N7)-methyltransferase
MTDVSRETPSVPDAARRAFSSQRLPLAERYVELLATAGVERGLIGPREAPRLWDRHILNSLALAQEVPDGVSVVDLGSGAGLPGLVLAIGRPDLSVTLVEPLQRRTTFLDEVVEDLGLDRVRVLRGRAESLHGRETFDVVTARALAPLGRLLAWAMPLVGAGGELNLHCNGGPGGPRRSGAARVTP